MLQKSKDPLGYTQEELIKICKDRNISLEAFDIAFGVNTVTVGEDGKPRYYKCDVERALFKLDEKDGINRAWD